MVHGQQGESWENMRLLGAKLYFGITTLVGVPQVLSKSGALAWTCIVCSSLYGVLGRSNGQTKQDKARQGKARQEAERQAESGVERRGKHE